MSATTRVDFDALKAAKSKLRTLTKKAEATGDPGMVHTAYKLGQFLNEALPNAWPLAEKVPDSPPDGNVSHRAVGSEEA